MKNESSIVLVTGGKGFVGSRLVKRLLDAGNKVVVVDNMSYGNEDNMIIDDEDISMKIDFYQDDVANNLSYIFEKYNFDYVFNIAGIAPLPDCQMNKEACLRSNVQGTMNMLELSRMYGVKRFFLSSTNAVYENVVEKPMSEDIALNTTLLYPTSKLMAEELCRSFNATYGMPTTIFRFANVYGEGMDIHRKYPPVTGAFIKKLFHNERPTVYGNGLQSRDFIYVRDLVDFALLVMNTSNASFEILNVGTGESHSIIEQLNFVKKCMNKESIEPIYIDEESFWEKMPAIYDGKHRIKDKVLFDEVNKCTCMDMTKVETLYGWKAKHSFEDGIKLTVEKMVEQLRKAQR